MENDDHSANDEFTSNSAGDHPEFSTWVPLNVRTGVLSASNLALALMMAAAFFLARITSL
jgi:hypothetical protein